jgi:Mg2+/citrate symporter
MRNKTLSTVLTVIGVVSMILFLTAGWFMTVYFKSGMIKEYGQQFTTAVEYCFGLGWIVVLASLLGSEAVHKKA